jgi:hypothetical protein
MAKTRVFGLHWEKEWHIRVFLVSALAAGGKSGYFCSSAENAIRLPVTGHRGSTGFND